MFPFGQHMIERSQPGRQPPLGRCQCGPPTPGSGTRELWLPKPGRPALRPNPLPPGTLQGLPDTLTPSRPGTVPEKMALRVPAPTQRTHPGPLPGRALPRAHPSLEQGTGAPYRKERLEHLGVRPRPTVALSVHPPLPSWRPAPAAREGGTKNPAGSGVGDALPKPNPGDQPDRGRRRL